ncbi:predicted protein [Histoplasma capsulatum G186AR]|uniref:Uncharacterized protein n=1 Tax=Ajellomyces capsulatus (strain G186AR / H82 / ATCC MYA-2454 / RMSCC 2432) TaxID=447093 RepID=C0NTG3_AJECG|nr:uncharacterized protein HCBG_06443 [Histoplasma capsulatum G186AR]EEH05324.1 predicted protein [Histoplasma capsulatum G186AR]
MDGIDKVLSGTVPDGAWSSGLKSMLIWLVISRGHACLSRARGPTPIDQFILQNAQQRQHWRPNILERAEN